MQAASEVSRCVRLISESTTQATSTTSAPEDPCAKLHDTFSPSTSMAYASKPKTSVDDARESLGESAARNNASFKMQHTDAQNEIFGAEAAVLSESAHVLGRIDETEEERTGGGSCTGSPKEGWNSNKKTAAKRRALQEMRRFAKWRQKGMRSYNAASRCVLYLNCNISQS